MPTRPVSVPSGEFKAIDPTANVIALVEQNAEAARALRKADIKYNDNQHAHLKEIGELRAAYAKEINILETKRLDAIRAVDQQAVITASDRTLQATNTLAAQSRTDAETLRALVVSTAATQSSQLDTRFSGFNDRITKLEQSSYEGKGKSQVLDPQMVEFMTDMRQLLTAQAGSEGKTRGVGISANVMVIAATLIIALIALIWNRNASSTAAAPTAPQVIYVPSPVVTPAPTPTKAAP